MGSHWRSSEMVVGFMMVVVMLGVGTEGALPPDVLEEISLINKEGPYLGIVVPNDNETSALRNYPSYLPNDTVPYLDVAGRRFHLAELESQKVIVVTTGLSMLNAGVTTQLLVNLFNVSYVLHYGIAGSANENFGIGDVTVPKYWAHSGLWNWQRVGDGPDDQLALEPEGVFNRENGHLNISHYDKTRNRLNNVWYQREEVFPVNGTAESIEHAFWVEVDEHLYEVAEKLKGLVLDRCVDGTCVDRQPQAATVERGASANVFVDNAAYSGFLNSEFKVTPIDMESAAVALVCLQQQMPFIAIRGISDLAGRDPHANETGIYTPLAAKNAVSALVRLIALLHYP